MVLKSNDKKLTFNVLGYEFDWLEYPKRGDYDSNWLVCEFCYESGSDVERITDPCILTYELKEIIDALEKTINERDYSYISEFLEPNFRVCISRCQSQIIIVVHFAKEQEPPDYEWRWRKISSCLYDNHAIDILLNLKEMYRKFPER